jgi:GAF domain-containing protein
MPEGLLGAIREFAGAIVNPFDVDELLQRLTERTLEVVDASGCGIMLQDEEGQLAFAAASDDALVEVELHQERINEGACYDAFQRNELVVIEDVGAGGERWPGYRDRVLAAGLRAVIGIPMNAFGRTIGVMNIYRSSPGPWTSDDVEAAEILTAIGAGYLVHAHDLRAQHELTEHLQQAIASRDLIGQAKGIIMAREDVDGEEAFAILRTTSQRSNRKLREIARLVVEGRIHLERDV